MILDDMDRLKSVRDELVVFRNECLGASQPGFMDPEGAVILSHAIRWLWFKIEKKPYEAE